LVQPTVAFGVSEQVVLTEQVAHLGQQTAHRLDVLRSGVERRVPRRQRLQHRAGLSDLDRLVLADHPDPRAFREGDSVAVNAAVAMLLEFQRSAGTRLHVLHVSSVEAIRMIRAAKAAGRAVSAEANPFAMFITNSWDRIERGGPYVLGQWVPEHDSEAMWEAVVDGTIDVIGSDHAPHTRAEKEPGWTDLYAAPSGSPMIAD